MLEAQAWRRRRFHALTSVSKKCAQSSSGNEGLLRLCFCAQCCNFPTVHALLQVVRLLGCPQSNPAKPGDIYMLPEAPAGRIVRCYGLCKSPSCTPDAVRFCLCSCAVCFKRAPAVVGCGRRGDVPEACGLPQHVCLVLEGWVVDRAHDLRDIASWSGHIQPALLPKAAAYVCVYMNALPLLGEVNNFALAYNYIGILSCAY